VGDSRGKGRASHTVHNGLTNQFKLLEVVPIRRISVPRDIALFDKNFAFVWLISVVCICKALPRRTYNQLIVPSVVGMILTDPPNNETERAFFIHAVAWGTNLLVLCVETRCLWICVHDSSRAGSPHRFHAGPEYLIALAKFDHPQNGETQNIAG
jgi:hypothetical protein